MNTQRCQRRWWMVAIAKFPALVVLLALVGAGGLAGCDDEPAERPPDAGPSADASPTGDTGPGASDAGPGDASLDAADAAGPDAGVLGSVAETERWELPGLEAPVHVVRTEANVPHIYAHNPRDLARVHGFVAARDRFFMMDMARRLGLGTLTEVLGDAALQTDIETRMTGSRHVAQRMIDHATPEILAIVDAYAQGINTYIAQVEARKLPAPGEVDAAWRLLGYRAPTEMMRPFERLDVAGMLALFLYQSSYETGDVRRAWAHSQLDNLYAGVPDAELRRQGAREDIWKDVAPVQAVASGDWGLAEGTNQSRMAPGAGAGKSRKGLAPKRHATRMTRATRQTPVNAALLERLKDSLARQHDRMLWRDAEKGFGSNAWAVAGAASTDGSSLLAGDGHLELGIPSILYQIGLDTSLLGQGDVHQLGLVIPGIPVMPLGTNGKVAWSFTQLMGDITDWYQEEIRLGEDGLPASSRFQGEWKQLKSFEEAYTVANVPLLGSTGRTERWKRFVTFDGRWLLDIEGRRITASEPVRPGEVVVRLHTGEIAVGDVDGDGIVSAVSFDYVGLDTDNMIGTFASLGQAQDVRDFREKSRGFLATSLNFTVGDHAGDIYYSAYQAVPCRGYLPRGQDGTWAPGAHPAMLLDGATYGGFRIPTRDGLVDEGPGAQDPYACAVPLAQSPQRLTPTEGYLVAANNDPASVAFDGRLDNDLWYIGGPWDLGFRADTIARELRKSIDEGKADIAAMSRIQGNHDSRLGELFVPFLLQALDKARALQESGEGLEGAPARLKQLYAERAEAFTEVRGRLEGWRNRGYQAHSGVETFYQRVSGSEAEDAVATMIFNAWFGPFHQCVFDDEGLPDIFQNGSGAGRIRALARMLAGRGANNPGQLASWNPQTGESIFFDKLASPEIETSDECLLRALDQALAFLESAPEGPGVGGFGTTDMEQWLWGLRHQVRFESLLYSYLRETPALGPLADRFSITTQRLPLAANLAEGDPRQGLKWFPRDGDQYGVDAANPGTSGRQFTHGSGPVMRMVIALRDGEVRGVNIIPGGQSGLPTSPHFDDQARLWLANEALPLRFAVEDVIAGATGREVYLPAP